MATPLFAKRHYEWLAAFAAQYLTRAQQRRLSDALLDDNPAFSQLRFHQVIANLTVSPRSALEDNVFTRLRDPASRREEIGGKSQQND